MSLSPSGVKLHRLLIILVIIAACKTRSRENVVTERAVSSAPEDTLLVALQRGACFGACPQFVCTVYKTGLAVYEGERNVKKTGTWKARISPSELEALRGLIRTYHMEQKDTVYINKYPADYPAYFITVSDFLPAKRIYVNHDQPPVEITGFVTELEKRLDALDWKSTVGQKSDE